MWFDETIGHYRCGLPWVTDRSGVAEVLNQLDLATNAVSRLKKSAYRMRREPERKAGVFKQMNAIFEDKHARKVTNTTVPDGLPVFHLPIHIATKPNKPGKFRVCQDAAAKIDGTCLNDLLLSGLDLAN